MILVALVCGFYFGAAFMMQVSMASPVGREVAADCTPLFCAFAVFCWPYVLYRAFKAGAFK